ncbi:hypothetical protein B4916_22385 [Yersinia intermedia]|nr:hypothetical protein B4916_22385 [Yersinia intermedia]
MTLLRQPNIPPTTEMSSDISDIILRIIQEDRRLRILRILSAVPAYITNERVLKRILPTLGHAVTSDLLRAEIVWLEEQGLLNIKYARELYVVQLTPQGEDVGQGLAQVPGIAVTSPQDVK